MIGFGLLCGHLVGDYIFQNDWMARWKGVPLAGRFPPYTVDACPQDREGFRAALEERNRKQAEHPDKVRQARTGHLACTIHCLLYTLAVWLFSHEWVPLWGLAAVFLAHWPIDRFRLAWRWMQYSGQKHFSSKEHLMFPWSIVVVDNTFHLVTLFAVARIHFDLL